MANLTITVEDGILQRARARATRQGTSVNGILSDYLEQFAGADEAANALMGFLELAASVNASSGPAGRTWTREDLYDRAVVRRQQRSGLRGR